MTYKRNRYFTKLLMKDGFGNNDVTEYNIGNFIKSIDYV